MEVPPLEGIGSDDVTGTTVLIRGGRENSSVSHFRTQPEAALPRNQIWQHLDLALPASKL